MKRITLTILALATVCFFACTKPETPAGDENGDSIWLCYETSKGLGYYYRYGSPGSSTGSKASTARWARCVKVVTAE